MGQIQWAADRGRPAVPVVPRNRVEKPAARPKQAPEPPTAAMPEVIISPFGMSFTYGDPEQQSPSMMRIIREVAAEHDLTEGAIVGERRTKEIVAARQHAMWRLAQEQRWSLARIGRVLGGRDHTTIIHGVRRHEQRLREAAKA